MLEINAPHWLDATRQEGYDAGKIDGWNDGRDKGILEGRNCEKRDIALNLKNIGMSVE